MIYREDGKSVCVDCLHCQMNDEGGIEGCVKEKHNNVYLPIGCELYVHKEEENKMEYISIQKKAIEHYKRMIAWAKSQNLSKKYHNTRYNHQMERCMVKAIGETWNVLYCTPICECSAKQKEDCFVGDFCPLFANDDCCDGLWYALNLVDNWGDWIREAEAVLEYIEEHGRLK